AGCRTTDAARPGVDGRGHVRDRGWRTLRVRGAGIPARESTVAVVQVSTGPARILPAPRRGLPGVSHWLDETAVLDRYPRLVPPRCSVYVDVDDEGYPNITVFDVSKSPQHRRLRAPLRWGVVRCPFRRCPRHAVEAAQPSDSGHGRDVPSRGPPSRFPQVRSSSR